MYSIERMNVEKRKRIALLKIWKTYYVWTKCAKTFATIPNRNPYCTRNPQDLLSIFFLLIFTSFCIMARKHERTRVSEHRIQYVLNSSNNKVANRLSILLAKVFEYFMNRKRDGLERSSLSCNRLAGSRVCNFECCIAWNETDVAIVHKKKTKMESTLKTILRSVDDVDDDSSIIQMMLSFQHDCVKMMI